jgi:hypothetical protein
MAMNVPVAATGSAASAVAAGAPGTEARAEADQQAREDQKRERCSDRHRWQAATQAGIGERRQDEARHEGRAPSSLARGWGEQSAEDAADAGDASVEEQEQGRGRADHGTAGEGADRREAVHGGRSQTVVRGMPGGAQGTSSPAKPEH